MRVRAFRGEPDPVTSPSAFGQDVEVISPPRALLEAISEQETCGGHG